MANLNGHSPLEWGPTAWSNIFAGVGNGSESQAARTALLLRYHEVVYEYFVRRLGNAEWARQLYSEFALRLLDTDRLVRNANPARGRFRDYLQGALWRMIKDWYREKGKAPRQFEDQGGIAAPNAGNDDVFDTAWKQEMISQAWKSLRQHERETGQLCYAVLNCKRNHEDLKSADLARLLSAELDQPFTEVRVRQLLHRARERFATFLLDEVERSLGNPTLEEVEIEVRKLGLLEHCEKVLRSRMANKEAEN